MKCRSCQTELNDKAIKCHECQSWQNWKRYFDLSTLIFGSIISLVTIAGIFFKPAYELIKERKPIIKVNVLNSSLGEARVMIANVGNSPAGIKEVYFHVDVFDGINIPAGKNQWGAILKQGESTSLTLERGDTYLPVIADHEHIGYSSIPKAECKIVIQYLSFENNDTKELIENMECYAVSPFPSAIINKRYK